jgi:transposase
LAEKPVFLEINRRQFKCHKCRKPFSEDLEFVSKGLPKNKIYSYKNDNHC